jgi:hypothetical protein
MERKAFVIVIILALFISACAAEKTAETPPPVNHSPPLEIETAPAVTAFSMDEPRRLASSEVSLRIRTSRITTETSWLDFELTNHTDTEFFYDDDFSLYKQIGGGWVYVDAFDDTGFSEIALILTPGSVNNGSIDVNYFFGVLGEGDYRIEKDIFSDDEWGIVSAEFTVTEAEK